MKFVVNIKGRGNSQDLEPIEIEAENAQVAESAVRDGLAADEDINEERFTVRAERKGRSGVVQ